MCLLQTKDHVIHTHVEQKNSMTLRHTAGVLQVRSEGPNPDAGRP